MGSTTMLTMGANHVDHDQLVDIVQKINKYGSQREISLGNSPEIIRNKYGIVFAQPYIWLPYVAELKYDGCSYLYDGADFISRELSTKKGNEGNPVLKTDRIHPELLAEIHALYNEYGAEVQGEVYIPGGTSDNVTSIMGCDPDKAQLRQQVETSKVHYVIVDVRRFRGKDVTSEPYYVRRAILDHMQERLIYRMKYVHTSKVYTKNIEDEYRKIVSGGGEGMVFKNTQSDYKPGKRANTWIKAKKSLTVEVWIDSLEYKGTGKNKDLFSALVVGITSDSHHTTFNKVHSGLSDSLIRDIYDNFEEKYEDQVIEVEAMDFNFASGGMRHARFIRMRPDKTKQDCNVKNIVVREELL